MHSNKTSTTIKLITMQSIQAITISLVQLIQFIQQTYSLGSVIAEHLTNHIRSIHAILITNVGTSQISIAFLKAKHITLYSALLFKFSNLLSNKLKTSENINSISSRNDLQSALPYPWSQSFFTMTGSAGIIPCFIRWLQI